MIEILGSLVGLPLDAGELSSQFGLHIIIQKTMTSMISTIMKQHSIRQVHT